MATASSTSMEIVFGLRYSPAPSFENTAIDRTEVLISKQSPLIRILTELYLSPKYLDTKHRQPATILFSGNKGKLTRVNPGGQCKELHSEPCEIGQIPDEIIGVATVF
jgi:hypothetical protein